MSTHDPWLALARAPGLHADHLRQCMAQELAPAKLVGMAFVRLYEQFGLPEAAARWLTKPDAAVLAADARWLAASDAQLVTWGSERYPPLLDEVGGAPPVLWVRGNPERLLGVQLAIVGSRSPTSGGLRTAREFAHYLAGAGLTITSGLALGIDAAAHEGALMQPGGTIAVLGCGLDVPYPPDNQPLAARIVAAGGALVTEFPPGTAPRKAHFPQRNRLISGLSLGTLVVEAARQSGSLITARMAGSQGREVFAIPGSIHNPLARGCHALIRQGAKLVEEAGDILSELKIPYSEQLLEEPKASPAAAPRLDNDYEILLDALGFEPMSIDALVDETGLPSPSVASMLLILELEGRVVAQPGGRYVRA
jgi:DNA processing protein